MLGCRGKKLGNLDGGNIQPGRVKSNEGIGNRSVLEPIPAETAAQDHPSSKKSPTRTNARTRENLLQN